MIVILLRLTINDINFFHCFVPPNPASHRLPRPPRRPKPGGDYTVLKEYIAAEEEGRQEGKDSARCAQKYRMCPLSVFAALRRLRGDVVAEMPTNTTISSPTGVSYLKDSVPWAWDTSAGEGY